jgi:hypothetical protein
MGRGISSRHTRHDAILARNPNTAGDDASEENKALARRFLEAQAKGDTETLAELTVPTFVCRSLLRLCA